MSRDTNGTYTAPTNSWNPAVEGATIDETDWNTTLDDIETALSDSLSVSGKGKITAHIDFDENASPGTPASNVGRLYAADVGGATSLMFKDAAGNVSNLLLVQPALAFTFDTSTTTNSDPGSGDIRFNNGTYASVTEIAVDDLDAMGNDVSTEVLSWDNLGNASARGYVVFQKRSASSFVRAVFLVTGSVADENGFNRLTVTHVYSSGTFAASDAVTVSFFPPGPAGVSGAGDTTGAASSTDNAIVRFDGTGGKTLQNSGVTIDDSGNVSGVVNLTQTGYQDLAEISAPSSPSANVARVYAVDSQSKTVPFWKDSAGVASALDIRTGWVQMYRTSDAGADPSTSPATWVVRAPDGSYVSTSGTTTQGVQEALNYCATYGYNLFINGGGGINSSDIDVATIHSTSGIDVPPLFKQAVVARGVTFNFGGSATYGWKVDSTMMSLLDLRSCQIVVATTTYEYGVWLRPRTANAVDPTIAITASDLLFGSIVHGKSTSTGLLIDTTEGPIIDGNFIEVHEPNGKGASGSDTAAYGVRIFDHATNVVKGNTFRILDAHGHGTASVAIGSSTTNGANIHSNHFDIHCDPANSSIGLDLYGAYNSIIARINDDEGTPTTGINIRSSGVYNNIIAPRIEATTKIADASAGFTNLIENEGIRSGGSNYIGTLTSISTVGADGTAIAARSQVHSTSTDAAYTVFRYSNDTSGPRIVLTKSRGTSVGSWTVAQSGDVAGELVFAAADGTDAEPVAAIRGIVNGTPGAGDMPGALAFLTTADGAEAVTERMRINNEGRLSLGTTKSSTSNASTITPSLIIMGSGVNAAGQFVRHTSPGSGGPQFIMSSTRGTDIDDYTTIQSGDGLGTLSFYGTDGDQFCTGAFIRAVADGAVSNNVLPTRLVFETNQGGGNNTTVEALRIDSAGEVYFPDISTTASAANAFLDSGSTPANKLLRSTSSLRYKTDVETLDPIHAEKLLSARPVWYRSKADSDRKDWSHYGLIAEELAQIEPRLVHYAYKPEDWEDVVTEGGTTRRVKEGAEKVPDGVAYDRMTVLLLSLVQKLWTRVGELEAKLEAK